MADKPIEIIKNDHRKVEDLFEDFFITEAEDDKEAIAQDICANLKVHMKMEEDVFYPEVAKISPEGKQMIDDSHREHRELKDLIEKLENIDPKSLQYDSTLSSLEDATLHHVAEEERKVLPFSQENMSDEMGIGMTAKMIAMKAKEMPKEIL